MNLPTRSAWRLAWMIALVAITAVAITAIVMATKQRRGLPVVPRGIDDELVGSSGRPSDFDPTPVSERSAITATRQALAQDRSSSRHHLDELRRALRQRPPAVASSAILGYLESKADAATGLGLKVGPDGLLTNSPTLRVFLLDQLGQIDPAAAAAQAKTLLSSMASSDEWAVALRNCALGDTSAEGRAFVGQRLEAMLTNEDWLRAPSVGFLEAFDVAVYLGGTNLIPTLAHIVRLKDNTAASHAAYLALDRLTISDAASTLAHLQANPDLLAGREMTRANYFARADVRHPAQKQVIETYLLNPNLVPEELDRFAALYPNANFMVSHNLLTRNSTPDPAWLAARDSEALRLVEQWLADARFAHRQPQLQVIRQRLESFAGRHDVP